MTTRKHTPTQVYFTQLYERTIKREGTTYTQGCKKVPVFWNRVTFRQELYCWKVPTFRNLDPFQTELVQPCFPPKQKENIKKN